MVNESLTTRLARERLAALKKYIPVRDKVREQLQQRQQLQTDFGVEREQLFAPITSATKDASAAIKKVAYGEKPDLEKDPTAPKRKNAPLLPVLEQIAAETGQTKRGIQQLSGDLQTQRETERLADIDVSDIPAPQQEGVGGTQRGVSFIDKLTEGAITQIKRPQLLKSDDYYAFGNFAAQSYYSRKDLFKRRV